MPNPIATEEDATVYTPITTCGLPATQSPQFAIEPYRSAWELYRDAGWSSPLPLPRFKKADPPYGFTGKTGAIPTASQLGAWAAGRGTDSRSNVGVRMPDFVLGIDVDQYVKASGKERNGAKTLAEVARKLGVKLPPTWSSTRRDPDGPSRIWFFRVPAGLKWKGDLGEDSAIELISWHYRYAVVWPSVVPDEAGDLMQYAWYDPSGAEADRIPAPDDLATLPPEWVDHLRDTTPEPTPGESRVCPEPEGTKFGLRTLNRVCAELAQTDEGGRNNAFNAKSYYVARLVAGGEINEEYAMARLTNTASEMGLEPDETEATLDSAFTAGKQKPKNAPEQPKPETPGQLRASHLDVARVLEEEHGWKLRHCPGLGWLVWDGRRWVRDEKEPERLVQEVTDDLLSRVHELANGDPQAAMGWCSFLLDKCRTKHQIRSIVGILATFRSIHVDAHEIDADPNLLLVGNGVVDLRTGQLLPNHPRYLLMNGTTVDYDPNAECPRWMGYLGWAFSGDLDQIEYLQDAFGVTLFGDNRHNVAFFLVGVDQSGKSTTVAVLEELVGSYAERSELSVFKDNNSGHSDGLAGLANKRLAIFSELDKDASMSAALFKQFTGEKKLKASFKGLTGFNFKVAFVPWISSNHVPRIRVDGGVLRRVKIIRYRNRIADQDRDTGLVEKMMATEGAGILAWAVRGAVRMANAPTMQDPPEVKQEVAKFAEENSPDVRFITECLEWQPGEFMRSSELWAIYQRWLDNGGENFVGREKSGGLTKALAAYAAAKEIPFETKKKINGNWGVRGIVESQPQEGDDS